MIHLSLFSRSVLRKESSPRQVLRTFKKMTNNITYHTIRPDKFQDVIEHLRRSFFFDEPLNKALSLSKRGEPHAELEDYSLKIMSQGLSTMALSGPNDEVVGTILMGSSAKETSPKTEYKDPKIQLIFGFIGDARKEMDLSKFQCGEIADLRILSVDETMRNKGIARNLYQRGEDIARELKFKVMIAEATGFFSQKVLAQFGWETIKEIKYSEYPSPENPTFKTEPPHESLKIMIKKLD